jgi:radical SAM superfamily enzyme YgiQ (UPF0313 family)
MKLALVNIDPKGHDPPLGLAYLAAYVKKYGGYENIVIIDEMNPIQAIRKEKPDIVGMGSYTYNFNYAKKLAKDIKEALDIPVIIGGYHITALPQHMVSSPFDVGVIGEGEQTLLELVQLYEKRGDFEPHDLEKIKGIVYNANGVVKFTRPRPLIEPLDIIPFPERDLLDMDFYLTLRKASFDKLGVYSQLITSRGCPYKCIFCAPTNFWRKLRFNSAEYMVNEIRMLKERYKVDGILIWDDLFIADRRRLEEAVRLLKAEGLTDLEFSVFGRANLMDDSVCRLLKEMNVTSIDFGLESGSDRILKYLKKETVTVENNRTALRLCKSYGMRTLGTFVIGSPDETEEDIRQTFELFNDENLDERFIFQLTPLPGTELWENAKREGIVTDDPDFDYSRFVPKSGRFKPDILLTKNIDKRAFENWFRVFQQVMDEKNRRIKISTMKLRNVKSLLSPRFLSKIYRNRKEVIIYIKKVVGK